MADLFNFEPLWLLNDNLACKSLIAFSGLTKMPKAWPRELRIFPLLNQLGFVCVRRVSEPEPFNKFTCSVYSEYRIPIYAEAVEVIDHVGETVERT